MSLILDHQGTDRQKHFPTWESRRPVTTNVEMSFQNKVGQAISYGQNPVHSSPRPEHRSRHVLGVQIAEGRKGVME